MNSNNNNNNNNSAAATIAEPSICIPRVFSNIDEKRIRRVFGQLNLGVIHHIDIIERTNEKGDKFNRVFIHFESWSQEPDAIQARTRLQEGKKVKIVYDDPWFWEVSAYRKKEPEPVARRAEPTKKPNNQARMVFEDEEPAKNARAADAFIKEQQRYSEQRQPDSRYSEQRYSDSRYSDSRYSDSRYSEQRYSEPRYSEQRRSEQRRTDYDEYGRDRSYDDRANNQRRADNQRPAYNDRANNQRPAKYDARRQPSDKSVENQKDAKKPLDTKKERASDKSAKYDKPKPNAKEVTFKPNHFTEPITVQVPKEKEHFQIDTTELVLTATKPVISQDEMRKTPEAMRFALIEEEAKIDYGSFETQVAPPKRRKAKVLDAPETVVSK